ncbi:hypothetical protein ACIRPZ_24710 [Streptomyces anulatus]
MTPREIDGVCHLPNQRAWAAVYGTAARNPRRTEDARTTLDAVMAYFEGRYLRQFFGHEVAAQLRVLAAAPPELVDHEHLGERAPQAHYAAFRHQFTNNILDVTGGDPFIAKAAGNWASAKMVDEVYGRPDLHSPEFQSALRAVWGVDE